MRQRGEPGDTRRVAVETGGGDDQFGQPVQIDVVPGGEGADLGIGASKSACEPGVHLGMPFPRS